MRLTKEAAELARMREAIGIACEAHREVMRSTRPGMFEFEIEEEIKHRLLGGLDDIGLTLQRAEAIDAFESSGAADRGPVTTALR